MRGSKLVFFLIRRDLEVTVDSFVKIQFSGVDNRSSEKANRISGVIRKKERW